MKYMSLNPLSARETAISFSHLVYLASHLCFQITFANVFIVDADIERSCCTKLGIHCTPALLFLWNGKPLTVRRPNWDDDVKFCGSISAENLLDLIRYAQDTGITKRRFLNVDF